MTEPDNSRYHRFTNLNAENPRGTFYESFFRTYLAGSVTGQDNSRYHRFTNLNAKDPRGPFYEIFPNVSRGSDIYIIFAAFVSRLTAEALRRFQTKFTNKKFLFYHLSMDNFFKK